MPEKPFDAGKIKDDRFVVFDFDGTIADSFSLMYRWFSEIASSYNLKILDYEEVRDLSTLEILKEMGVSWYQLPAVVYKAKAYMGANLDRVSIFENAKETLEKIKEDGCRVFVLSSNSRENISAFLAAHGISAVDLIVSDSSIFGKEKKVIKVMQEYQISKDRIIYVGDEVRDIQAMKKIGIKIIAVNWGWDSEALLKKENPDFLAKDWMSLERFVKEGLAL